MMGEWAQALRGFPIEQIDLALSDLVRTSKWWPSIAEVVDQTKRNAPPLPQPKALAGETGWEGVDVAEEVKRRSRVIAEAKRMYGFDRIAKTDDPEPPPLEEPIVYDVPVSDLSEALRAKMGKARR